MVCGELQDLIAYFCIFSRREMSNRGRFIGGKADGKAGLARKRKEAGEATCKKAEKEAKGSGVPRSRAAGSGESRNELKAALIDKNELNHAY